VNKNSKINDKGALSTGDSKGLTPPVLGKEDLDYSQRFGALTEGQVGKLADALLKLKPSVPADQSFEAIRDKMGL